ncbi:MAG: NAD-dependent epimerase/dehydratase family protein [Acidimicrobiia bacterium]
MRVLILGGDGYLGWPTAMYFSKRGHEVAVIDDFTRRHCHLEQGSDSLTPVSTLQERVRVWKEITGLDIAKHTFDLCDYDKLAAVVRDFQPEAIVHYGQIPSAPYSMVDQRHATSTQLRNVENNLNVIFAIREHAPNCHLVKLGTMGEYGQPNIDIEEGYIDIEHNGRTDRLPMPKLPGSWYHLSKVHDSHNIHFACRIYGLRATDLNQGVVYGVHTEETMLDPRLVTRFDYDEQFGTALNRFCVQAMIGFPLTVYGTGGQTRGYLNIRDTMRCVELAVLNPADAGEFRVFNQFTEQFSVLELAKEVQKAAGQLGYHVEIDNVKNPRKELEEHYYNAKHQKLVELGLEPTPLSDELVTTMLTEIERHKDRVVREFIAPRTTWL